MRRAPSFEEAFVYIEDPAAPSRSGPKPAEGSPHCRTTVSLLHGPAFDALVQRTLMVGHGAQAPATATGWVSRNAFAVEGITLSLGDFTVRAGLCSHKSTQHPGVILLEVEYAPADYLPPDSTLLSEFLDFILPNAGPDVRLVDCAREFAEADLPVPNEEQGWTQMHRNVAYVACLRQQGLL
jgi:hypothetical protein